MTTANSLVKEAKKTCPFGMSKLEECIIRNRFLRYERYLQGAKASSAIIGASLMTYEEWDNFTFDKENPDQEGME